MLIHLCVLFHIRIKQKPRQQESESFQAAFLIYVLLCLSFFCNHRYCTMHPSVNDISKETGICVTRCPHIPSNAPYSFRPISRILRILQNEDRISPSVCQTARFVVLIYLLSYMTSLISPEYLLIADNII